MLELVALFVELLFVERTVERLFDDDELLPTEELLLEDLVLFTADRLLEDRLLLLDVTAVAAALNTPFKTRLLRTLLLCA